MLGISGFLKYNTWMTNSSDWRLTNQEKYLKGVVLIWKEWTSPKPDWDHDHCEFCWKKITNLDLKDAVTEGYCTENDYYWICESCYNDFREQFRWIAQKDGKFACPCCGSFTLTEKPPGTFSICEVCGWEDDNIQYDDPTYW